MHVRIASFKGDPSMVDTVRSQVESDWESPPEGLEAAREMWMLVDRENGVGLGMTVYDSEEDLRRGDEALNAMSPEGGGERTNVAFYEVALHKERS
jgi:hypothetical protein